MLNGTRSASSPRKTACIRDLGVNGTLSLLARLLLVLYRFDHCYDVLHRRVGHYGMGRAQDIASICPYFIDQALNLSLYLLGGAVGQEFLNADTAVETEPVAIFSFNLVDVPDLRLEGIVNIQPDLDEVLKYIVDLTIGVHIDKLPRLLYPGEHARHKRLEESPPVLGPHD